MHAMRALAVDAQIEIIEVKISNVYRSVYKRDHLNSLCITSSVFVRTRYLHAL